MDYNPSLAKYIQINLNFDHAYVRVNYTDTTALLVEDDYVCGVVAKKLCERRNNNVNIVTSGKASLVILKNEGLK